VFFWKAVKFATALVDPIPNPIGLRPQTPA